MDLRTASDLALSTRWRGIRKSPTYEGWCAEVCELWSDKTLATLTTQDVRTYVALLEAEELAPATVFARVSHLRTLYTVAREAGSYTGPEPDPWPYPRVPRKLKWWLNPDQRERAEEWLRQRGTSFETLRDYLPWSCETGLRVEESLSLTPSDFFSMDTPVPYLMVPGTKTVGAQSTLPLGSSAAEIARRRIAANPNGRLFPTTYLSLWSHWREMAEAMGWPETASLKALRRTYARGQASKGCPLPVLQQMMRHKDPSTTMEYLRLTGGQFTMEEMRRWA